LLGYDPSRLWRDYLTDDGDRLERGETGYSVAVHSPGKAVIGLAIAAALAITPNRPAQSRCREHPWCDTVLSPDARGGPPAASAREHGVATLARLYYDLAGTPIPHSLRGLLGIAQVEHLLYASDTSFTPANLIERAVRALVETDVLDEEQKAGLRATYTGS
jgi:hypothetical protein